MRQRSTTKRWLQALSPAAACVAAICGDPAGAQLRLHSASEEKATASLAEELEKARTTHLAAFEAHRAYLVDALAREGTLLVQRELAERDALLTMVLSARSRDAGAELLGYQIDSEWTALSGTMAKPAAYRDFVSAARHLGALEIERTGLLRNRATLISLFESKGGAGTYCDAAGTGTVVFAQMGDLPEAVALEDSCSELAENRKQIEREYARAGGASALVGDTSAGAAGEIGEALRETREIAELITAQKAVVSAVSEQTKALDSYYRCQLGRSSSEQAVRTDVAAVQIALDQLADGDPEKIFAPATFTDLWDTLRTRKVDPDCTKPARPAAPADASAGPSAADILSAVANLDKYAADDALLALAQETALDIQGSALGEALKGLAAEPSNVPDGKTARRAMAALRMFGALDQLYLAKEGQLPDTAGILVALADVRMRQATAKIEADRLAAIERLGTLRLAALRQRAVLLADANVQLAGKSDAALAGALRRYSESVNRGAIPSTVLANDMVKSRYLSWLDREKAIVEAAYAMLTPAVAQLEVYGKGGITADTIAQFLQAAGLGGIAVK